jgi:hypothetical protein
MKAAKDLKARGLLNVNGSAGPPRTNSLPPSSVSSRMPSPAPSLASNNSELEDDGGSVGRETRRRLVEWWGKEYCASRMRLCIIGKGTCTSLCDSSRPHNRILRFVGPACRACFRSLFSYSKSRARSPSNDLRPSFWATGPRCMSSRRSRARQIFILESFLGSCIHSNNYVVSFPRYIIPYGVSASVLET